MGMDINTERLRAAETRSSSPCVAGSQPTAEAVDEFRAAMGAPGQYEDAYDDGANIFGSDVAGEPSTAGEKKQRPGADGKAPFETDAKSFFGADAKPPSASDARSSSEHFGVELVGEQNFPEKVSSPNPSSSKPIHSAYGNADEQIQKQNALAPDAKSPLPTDIKPSSEPVGKMPSTPGTPDTPESAKGADGPDIPDAALSASALLDSLFGARMQGTVVSADAVSTVQTPATDTADLVDKLVDRILVSEPGKGQAEVRISLRDGALPGTELTLSRSPDGQLMVRMTSTNPASFQTLVAAQDSLVEVLTRQGENVRVEVNHSEEAHNQDMGGDSRQSDARERYQEYQRYQTNNGIR